MYNIILEAEEKYNSLSEDQQKRDDERSVSFNSLKKSRRLWFGFNFKRSSN